MTCPRVGHINFLNVLPLTWSYAHGADQGLAITRGVPAVLNNDIVNHRLDVSNVSSIIYARDSEELVVLPDVCVSSDGDVQSILLVSRKPIGDLRDDKIILTAKSATSHCLLKIILRGAYGAIPNYYVRHITPEDPIPEDAAASLLIGDDALWLYHHQQPDLYYYDLGHEWKQMTGKKMVYALWVANKDFAAQNPALLQLVYDRIHHAFQNGLAHKREAIESILAGKPFTYEQLDDYLGPTIRWELTEEYLDGLRTFYDLAHQMNLIEHIPTIKLADVQRS
ncbi:chorismate dehydratase [Selenomonas ruminantium]|uniref:Chorismate dehydratase n=1 Tax=Selenomonas ruminantium TaxID=971 RepID=A0A1I3HQV3_SELRU|nr:menaquinone biosynthesis protein [Selenomonas ruminantium]SFI38095.1 chorismate dehydratase [Selenomonas ruminantium]